jgi:hypothetical protein
VPERAGDVNALRALAAVVSAAFSGHDRGMRFGLAAAVPALVALASCSTPNAPAPASAGSSEPAEERLISINLKDASVADVLEAISAAARVPLVVDPDAQAVADCARLTVLSPERMPAKAAVRLVGEALQPSGLLLVESDAGGLIVRRAPGAPLPATCSQAAAGAPPATPDPPARAAVDPEVQKKIAAGIRRISETEVEITEEARDLFFADAALASRARIVPAMRDGSVWGMKLFGIRGGDVLAGLGLRNGDTLLRLGGQPISSPEKALEAYAAVREAKVIEAHIERKGQEMRITYRIVAK